MTRLAALFALIPYVVAASPPLNLVNVADLNSIFPAANGSGTLKNVTQLPDIVLAFPPGPQPPDPPGALFYRVPRSNPKITLRFRDYLLNPGRNDSDTYDVFRIAMREASDPTLRDTAMPIRGWDVGGVEMHLSPVDYPEELPFMTWGLWHMALTGIDNFRRFYPKLNFWFEVYVCPDGDEHDKEFIAVGFLDG